MNNKIKDINIGVSIYSMTAAYTSRLLTFDECVKKAADMGYEGIEIVAPQSVPDILIRRRHGVTTSAG